MKTIEERFKKLYPGKRLLAVKLDGFSHSIWFDDGNKESPIIQDWYSANMPEAQGEHKNNEQVKKLFEGYPHYKYQNNSEGITYILPDQR